MSQRKAVTRATATRYRSASKSSKALILDELCATTGWHRDHARKALRQALRPRPVAPAELALLNRIYGLLRLHTNFFAPQQKLVEKHREGAKVTKRYDTAATPYQRILAEATVTKKTKTGLTRQYQQLNPAQIRRDLLDLQDQLLDLVKTKHQPTQLPVKPPPAPRAKPAEATKRAKRAS